MRTAVAVLLALSMNACSWAFMTKPPDPPPPAHVYIYCTESNAAPVLDLLVAVPNGLMALAGLAIIAGSDSDDEFEEGIEEAVGYSLLISGGITALVYGLSARSGFKSSARCRELKNQRHYQQWRPAPQGPPGWNEPPR